MQQQCHYVLFVLSLVCWSTGALAVKSSHSAASSSRASVSREPSPKTETHRLKPAITNTGIVIDINVLFAQTIECLGRRNLTLEDLIILSEVIAGCFVNGSPLSHAQLHEFLCLFKQRFPTTAPACGRSYTCAFNLFFTNEKQSAAYHFLIMQLQVLACKKMSRELTRNRAPTLSQGSCISDGSSVTVSETPQSSPTQETRAVGQLKPGPPLATTLAFREAGIV